MKIVSAVGARPNFMKIALLSAAINKHNSDNPDMLRLNMGAKIMLMDSGGLQEECCILGTPCLAMRWNTERPVTLREYGGASVLVGNNVERIKQEFRKTLASEAVPARPELWDGHTAVRIVSLFSNEFYE